jgi:hypothetical protein
MAKSKGKDPGKKVPFAERTDGDAINMRRRIQLRQSGVTTPVPKPDQKGTKRKKEDNAIRESWGR